MLFDRFWAANTRSAAMIEKLAGDLEMILEGEEVEARVSRKELARILARSAVKAMREPSVAMIHAFAMGLDHPSVYMGGPSKNNMLKAKRVLPAIFDAALGESDESP